MRWDLFCRVIDNHGDLGVSWRLARDLSARGDAVRLWVDDPSALAWMAPARRPGIELRTWHGEAVFPAPAEVADVVVEAFGCELPPGFVDAMAARAVAPVWINLEYLSAEDYVERSHGLPSPQRNGLTKWFFYPGFTARTGGLLREQALMAARQAHDGRAWLARHGWAPADGERVLSLFCYAQPALDAALSGWLAQGARWLVLATPGWATQQMRTLQPRSGLRTIELPWLDQDGYDRLLWSCDLNAVRGEDSFVRAQWAAAPMLWQTYPQHDGVHAHKLQAWLDRLLSGAPGPLAAGVRAQQLAWNGLAPVPQAWPALPDLRDWRAWQQAWCRRLLGQDDLVSALRAFVRARLEHGGASRRAC